jgi:hypothetical protein
MSNDDQNTKAKTSMSIEKYETFGRTGKDGFGHLCFGFWVCLGFRYEDLKFVNSSLTTYSREKPRTVNFEP